MANQGDADEDSASGDQRPEGIAPGPRIADESALEFERSATQIIIGTPQRSVFGCVSLVMFTVTLCLFFGGMALSSESDLSAIIAGFSLVTSLSGVITGIIGIKRPERNPEWSKTGVCLNGLWLVICGVLSAIAYSMFGGMSGI